MLSVISGLHAGMPPDSQEVLCCNPKALAGPLEMLQQATSTISVRVFRMMKS